MTHAVVKQSDAQEAQMAEQLSQQYQRAVGGLWEVMKFGAMMLKLREFIVSTRGHVRTGGPGSAGTGIEGWLKEHCPDIARPTAYRFMLLADGLKKELELGAKADLCQLLDRDGDPLTPAQQRTRNEIALFLEGKSQRQLLFRFAVADPKPRGGARENTRGMMTEEIIAEGEAAGVRILIGQIREIVLDDRPRFARCNRQLLEELHGALLDAKNVLGKVLKK